MKTKVTAYTRYVSLLLFVLGFLTLQSQPVSNIKPTSKTITGKVVDENNAGLSGVTIRSNEGNASVTTLADGSFSITTLATAKSLIVTYIGYADQQVNITGTVLDNIKVLPDSKAIESVVVVGYGTRKKTDVTAAIASVSGEKLRQVPTTNLTQALQGRITGVEAAASGFRPGSGSRIRIRGSRSLTAGNDPLYVVDGFPVTYTIDDMNPLDIESIDILKDASATAVYGVRGANGVVQITTKKAKAGKITLDYSGSQSYETHSNPTRMLNAAEITDSWRQAFYTDRQYNYTQSTASPNNYYPDARSDARMFLELGNQNQWNGIKDAYSWRVFDPVNKIYIANKRASTQQEKDVLKNLGLAVLDSLDIYDPSKLKNYDWANEGLRQGVTKSHNVTMSAGTDKIKTTFSGSYFNQKGIEYGQDYTRYSVGNSNEFKINKNIMFGSTVTYANTTQNTSTSSLGNALGMIPLAEAYDSAGNYILYPNGDRQIASAINDRNTVFDETKVNRLFGNIYGEITILKGLKFRTMFGLDTRNSRRGTFNGANSSVQQGALANASQTVSNSVSWVYDNILTYNTTIANDHSINVTALYELQKLNRASSLTMSAQNLIFEEQKWYSLNRNTLATVNGSGTFTEAQYLSYMGRLEYGYKNKYLLTVSNRYDNSSVLADGNKGAYFPSASVAWRLENEDFFTKQKLFTTAKIRLGIGRVGNASIDPYQTNGPLEFTGYNWGNGSAAIGLAPTTFRTPGLTWEKTTTKNLGLDFGLLRNRVVGSIDMYSSSTIDMLQRKTIPAANGVQTVFVNIGEVSNKGFELSLTTQNIVSKNGLNWSTDFVFSKNKEKIVDIDGTRTEEGRQLRFAKDTDLPGVLATIRAATSPRDNDLRGPVAFTARAGDTLVAATVTFSPVRFVKLQAMTKAAFDFAGTAVEIALGLIGVLALWLGLLRIAETSGLIQSLVRWTGPAIRPLFPGVPHDHPALGLIVLNMTANMLGLGNAATPLGIKAMESLQTLNPDPDTATDDEVMFMAINTASVQLVPPVLLVAVLGLEVNKLIFPIILVTALSLVVAIVSTRGLGRLRRFRATSPTHAAVPSPGPAPTAPTGAPPADIADGDALPPSDRA